MPWLCRASSTTAPDYFMLAQFAVQTDTSPLPSGASSNRRAERRRRATNLTRGHARDESGDSMPIQVIAAVEIQTVWENTG